MYELTQMCYTVDWPFYCTMFFKWFSGTRILQECNWCCWYM